MAKKKSGAPVMRGFGFRGMNNLPGMPATFADTNKIITPQVVVNADPADGSVLRKRGGFTKVASLSNCHSLWGGSLMFCVAEGILYPQSLYKIEGLSIVELCEVPGSTARMHYAEIGTKVYCSNPHFSAIFDMVSEDVLPWGAPLPSTPSITLVAGNLPPGVYQLAYTRIVGGQKSGNGPIIELLRDGDSFGIQLNNLPEDGQAWITHPEGDDLFLAVVTNGQITNQAPEVQPLDSYNVLPAPNFRHFAHGHGRIWGLVGKRLYYSDPQIYSWFRARNYLPFLEDLVLVAPVQEGIFVNSATSTWFLKGTEPQKMSLKRVGDGAVPGSLSHALVEGTGYEISKRLTQVPSPIWLSPKGLVVGTQTGHLVHMTEGRMRMNVHDQGAALYRFKNGIPQLVTTTWGVPLKDEDSTLKDIFDIGRLYLPKPISVVGEGGFQIS